MDKALSWIDGCELGRLAIMPRPSGGLEIGLSISALATQHVGVLVSLLTPFEELALDLSDEKNACDKYGIEFLSFPIPDRGLPESANAVRRLVEVISARLREDKNVVIHCRMGIGRSGMIAACVLASHGFPVVQAFNAISHARGVQVPDTEEQQAWVEKFALSFPL